MKRFCVTTVIVLMLGQFSFAEDKNLEPEKIAAQKVTPNVPRVTRDRGHDGRNVKVYFHLPLIGDMLMNRPEDLRVKLLDPIKDKALIEKHRIPIWPFPNTRRAAEKPAAYAIVRNRLMEIYTIDDEDEGFSSIYRVDLHFEPIHMLKMDGLMAHFRMFRYEQGKSRSKYFKGVYRQGKIRVDVHVRRQGSFTGKERNRVPNNVKAISPFVMTIELAPVEWYALKYKPSDSVLSAMRKGEILLGMYEREVRATLAHRYRTDWQGETVRVHNGKDTYTIHLDGGTVQSLTR